MRFLSCLLVWLAFAPAAFATHIIGGYVRAVPVAGQANTYRVTVTMYYDMVNGTAAATAAQTIAVCFGDGQAFENISRTSSQPLQPLGGLPMSLSEYATTHTYSGPGVYTLQAAAINRNENIRNINGDKSTGQTFTLRTVVQVGINNQTPQLSLPTSLSTVALSQRVLLSLAGTDPEGDSLSYALTLPLTSAVPTEGSTKFCASVSAVTGYQYPNDVSRVGTFRLNARTGQLDWTVPIEQGRFSVAIQVSEWRNGALISQTQHEIMLVIIDRGGTPTTPPAYEPAQTTLITATSPLDRDALQLTVSPNPVSAGLIQVELKTVQPTPVTLQLLDGQGCLYETIALPPSSTTHRHAFDIGQQPAGLYLIRAESNGQQVVRKVIRQ